MSTFRLVGLTFLGCLSFATAQETPAPAKMPVELQKTEALLREKLIPAKSLEGTKSLSKLLDVVQRALPAGKKLILRIDKEAFGDKYTEVAATPVTLTNLRGEMSLHDILWRVVAKIKLQADYRVEPAEVVITTPARARYTLAHDVRDLLAKPHLPALGIADPGGTIQKKAHHQQGRLAEAVFSILTGEFHGDGADGHAQILNRTELLAHVTGTQHAEIHDALQSLRHIADLAVIAHAHLYEVDDAFHTRLKNAKRISLEESERIFVDPKAPKGESHVDLLPKQKLILAGDEIKLDDRQKGAILARQEVRACSAGPAQVLKDETHRQVFVTGISFAAEFHVGSDRRSVQMKLTEKAVELEAIDKVKVYLADSVKVGEVPLLKETTQARLLDIPDGGSTVVPVVHRPRALAEKNRWWVLSVTARIHMEDEERHILANDLAAVLPVMVADVLKNPRLKAMREMYGTPGDTRFALVGSGATAWPKDFKVNAADFQLTPAKKEGNRLLGIRIDKTTSAPLTVTLSLLNAGGGANGPVPGAGVLHYTAHHGETGWTIELREP